MRSHIEVLPYNLQVGDKVIEKVALFNNNKIPTGMVHRCLESDTDNKYLITMTKEKYIALFLDDGELAQRISEETDNDSTELLRTDESDSTSEDN